VGRQKGDFVLAGQGKPLTKRGMTGYSGLGRKGLFSGDKEICRDVHEKKKEVSPRGKRIRSKESKGVSDNENLRPINFSKKEEIRKFLVWQTGGRSCRFVGGTALERAIASSFGKGRHQREPRGGGRGLQSKKSDYLPSYEERKAPAPF